MKFVYDEHYFKVVFIREQEAKLRAEFDKSSHDHKYESESSSEEVAMTSEEIGIGSEETSEQILKLMRSIPRITAIKIADKLKITSRAVEHHISILKRTGKIERTCSTKSGSWRLIVSNIWGLMYKIKIGG